MKQLLGILVFALTLFASTASDERAAPVQRLGEDSTPMRVGARQPFLCDSVQAEDCFLMFAAEHPPDSITLVPQTRASQNRPASFQPVACSFPLPFGGDRCGMRDR